MIKGVYLMNYVANVIEEEAISKVRAEIKDTGFYILKNAYPKDFCQSIIQFIDDYKPLSDEIKVSNNNVEMHYDGTEMRIWDAQKKSTLLQSFYDDSNLAMSRLLKKDTRAFTLMAIRNKQLQADDISLMKGRWHIDSFFRQLKIFLFLTDTSDQSGPFEFIPGTHRTGFKFKN